MNPMKIKPREWVVTQYESGWYIEKPDYTKPIEDCVFIEIGGPYKTEALARADMREMMNFARRAG